MRGLRREIRDGDPGSMEFTPAPVSEDDDRSASGLSVHDERTAPDGFTESAEAVLGACARGIRLPQRTLASIDLVVVGDAVITPDVQLESDSVFQHRRFSCPAPRGVEFIFKFR